MRNVDLERLRAEILDKTRRYIQLRDAPKSFEPGKDTVPYAGRVFDEEEVEAGVGSMLDFWLTLGPEAEVFEKKLSRFLDVRSTVLVNSGSSANLLAASALTSPALGERRICRGDEVITTAAGFPTTVAPIFQCGAVPVFIDTDPTTANIRVDRLEDAYVPGKTKAIMVAHALGNPCDIDTILNFCKEKNIWFIEDNCDALGSTYNGRLTGTFGDLSTQSFYPPHHITLGEGGAVNIVKSPKLRVLVESFRDWGRDCWCPSGQDNTCGKRFEWELGELPEGYDHKYIYSHLGYNLKPIDPQAAIGQKQLDKLPAFIKKRQENWLYLRKSLADLEDHFDFMLPTHATSWNTNGSFSFSAGSDVQPSWFGFLLLIKNESPLSRTALARHLDEAKIGNRMLFGGNLTRQPVMVTAKALSEAAEQPAPFRVVGDLNGADRMMQQALFVGTYPGLTEEHLAYISDMIHRAVESTGAAKR